MLSHIWLRLGVGMGNETLDHFMVEKSKKLNHIFCKIFAFFVQKIGKNDLARDEFLRPDV